MAKQVGIAYPVKNDILLKKGEQLHFVTDNNKFWFAVNGNQITEPRQGFRVNGDSDKLWIHKSESK